MQTQQTVEVSPYSKGHNGTATVSTVITAGKSKEFDWIPVLTALAEGAQIDESSAEALHRRAANWPTCACGQLCRRLPRMRDGQPYDTRLSDLGYLFHTEVGLRSWARALGYFHQIEARVTTLLNAPPAKA